MADGGENHDPYLRRAAAVIALAITMVGLAVLLYHLIDILLILFLGIVVAAALQPWHERLCRFGAPRGVAVLLIYVLFLSALILIGLLVGPVLIEQLTAFGSTLPEKYAGARDSLITSRTQMLRLIGERLPPFAAVVGAVSGAAPALYESLVGVTTGFITTFAYFIAVLAVGFYWTMELPRLERLILSLLPLARRAQVLNIWHEIEFKLGAFIRGQGTAMLIVGVASGVGYALIGLPNVLVLAVLAGLLEAVPLIGPLLAAVPAVLVALPLGLTTVLLVIGWSILLQGVENNILLPRIMSHAVGVSALVGLVAVLAFGTLYGVLGVLIAIPLAATVQVLLDRMVINAETIPENEAQVTILADLRTRLQTVQQEMRRRFRERETRMGIDPRTPDHIVDAAELQLEKGAERVAALIGATEDAALQRDPATQATILRALHEAIRLIEQAVDRVDSIVAAADRESEAHQPRVELPLAELDHATQKVERAIEDVESVMASPTVSSHRADAAPIAERDVPRQR